MKLIIRSIVLALIGVGLVPAPAFAFVGGVLSSNLTLTKSNSPYVISQAVQIPEGVTLTVEPGVVISSELTSELFYVNGTIRINGNSDEPVRISTKGTVFYLKNAANARVDVRYASIDGGGSGTLVAATGYSQYSHYSFLNSDFSGFGGFSYIWYPLSFVAEKNVFTDSPGFSIGFDGRGNNEAPVFRNNLFLGAPKSTFGKQYWIEAWASYGSTLIVSGNSFVGGPYNAISTTSTYDVIDLDAKGNFWGTTDSSEIASMVLDRTDGLDYGTRIDYSNFLSSADPQTPTGRRYSEIPPQTSAPQYGADEEGPLIKKVILNSPSAIQLGREISVTLEIQDSGGNGVRNVQFVLEDKFGRQHTPAEPVNNCRGNALCSLTFVFSTDANWGNNGYVKLSWMRVFDRISNGTYYYGDGRVQNLQSRADYADLSPFSTFAIAIGDVAARPISFNFKALDLRLSDGLAFGSVEVKDSSGKPLSGQSLRLRSLSGSQFMGGSREISTATSEAGVANFLISGVSATTGTITIEVDLNGQTARKTYDLAVYLPRDAEVETTNSPVTSKSSWSVTQRTLARFSGTHINLTDTQRRQIGDVVRQNPSATKFICTGIRHVSQSVAVNIIVRKRAIAACDYARSINPRLATWVQSKATSVRSYSGRTLLTVKAPQG